MADGGYENGWERTGPALLAHVLLRRLLTLMGLNVLYLLCCLPVLTVPAASAGLMRSMRSLLDDGEEARPFRLFFRAGLDGFWHSTLCGGAVLLLFAAAVGAALYYFMAETPAALPFVLFCTLMAVYLYASAGCAFAMLERVVLPAGALIKNALLLPAVEARSVLPPACGSMAVLLLCVWTFPRSLPFVVLIVPAAAALTQCYGTRRAVEKNILKG